MSGSMSGSMFDSDSTTIATRSSSNNSNNNGNEEGSKPVTRLLQIVLEVCEQALRPIVEEVYSGIISKGGSTRLTGNGSVTVLCWKKNDGSDITIADGMLDWLLKYFLENVTLDKGGIIGGIVCEEDDLEVQLEQAPYFVGSGNVLDEVWTKRIDAAKKTIREIVDKHRLGRSMRHDKSQDQSHDQSRKETSAAPGLTEAEQVILRESRGPKQVNAGNTNYKGFTCFIDPLDATKEFVNGKGECSCIMFGLAQEGSAVGGAIYFPLTKKWAFGCEKETSFNISEGVATNNDMRKKVATGSTQSDFLISATEQLNNALGYVNIKAGGAGYKAMLLLRNEAQVYLGDRGVCRWDTCASEALIQAAGGRFYKLNSFLAPALPNVSASRGKNPTGSGASSLTKDQTESYHYEISHFNLDPNDDALLTKRNSLPDGTLLPYANICGFISFTSEVDIESVRTVLMKVAKTKDPRYT